MSVKKIVSTAFFGVAFAAAFFFSAHLSQADGTVYYFANTCSTLANDPCNYWLDSGLTMAANAVPDLSVDELHITSGSTYSTGVGETDIRGNGENQGTINSDGTVSFFDNAVNNGTIAVQTSFHNNSSNTGNIGAATFHDNSTSNGGTITGAASFYDNSSITGGMLGAQLDFYDNSHSAAINTGEPLVYHGDSSYDDVNNPSTSMAGKSRVYSGNPAEIVNSTQDFNINGPWTVTVDYVYLNLRDATTTSGMNFNLVDGGQVTNTPVVSINNPAPGDTVSNWSPSVNWDNATTCQYSFTSGDSWSSVDCGSGGSDIPAPQSSGSVRLDINAYVDGWSSARTEASFTYSPVVNGCTNSSASNYNSSATSDDGSCVIYGCTNSSANNYNSSANIEDGSCTYTVSGCTNSSATNYNSSANSDDGSCTYSGCTDSSANNYNPAATSDNGSCTYTVNGCMDPAANNYNPSANNNDNTCTYTVNGCTDPAANNYNSSANYDDGSCTFDQTPVNGCTNSSAANYNPSATTDDGSCLYTAAPTSASINGNLLTVNFVSNLSFANDNYPNEFTVNVDSAPYATGQLILNSSGEPDLQIRLDNAVLPGHTVTVAFSNNNNAWLSSLNGQGSVVPFSDFPVEDDSVTNSPTISSPVTDTSVSSWNPSVSYGGSVSCLYSYNNETFTPVDCSSNGSDIPPPTGSGEQTLYIEGTDGNGNFGSTETSFSYQPPVRGCTDSMANNFNADAQEDDGSCDYSDITPPQMVLNSPTEGQEIAEGSFSASVNWDDAVQCGYAYDENDYTSIDCSAGGSDIPPPVTAGSHVLSVRGYDSSNNEGVETARFTYDIKGCTDSSAQNYNSSANVDDGSCVQNNPDNSSDNNATSSSDTTPPQISNVTSGSIATTSARITWSTDEIATSQVIYGVSTSTLTDQTSVSDRTGVTSHAVSVSGLRACTLYYYEVTSTDLADTPNTATDNTVRSFITTGCTGSENAQTTSATTVSTSGGNASLPTGGGTVVSLQIPNGAATTSLTYQIKKLDGNTALGSTGVPTGYSALTDHVYDFKAYVSSTTILTSFDQPISVTLSYGDQDLIGVDESTLIIERYDGSSWTPLSNCVINQAANTITCDTNNFSVFGIFGQAPVNNGNGGGTGTTVSNNVGSYGPTAYSTSGHFNATGSNNATVAVTSPFFSTSTIAASSVFTAVPPVAASSTPIFYRNLTVGSRGSDAMALQTFLNQQKIYVATSANPGSVGNETSFFGSATKAALKLFQAVYHLPVTGFFGSMTRAMIRVLFGK